MRKRGGEFRTGNLEQAIPVPKRVGHPRGKGRVAWATGDDTLGMIAAVNWETREYIVEESQEYLSEANPPHRRIVIGDAAQLSDTCVVAAWRRPYVLLFLGAADRHVLEWAKKGVCEKGDRFC